MRQSGGQCGNQRGGTACATLLGDGVVELQSEGLWGRAWPNPGRSVCPTPRRLLVAADRVSPGAPQPWAHARLNCHPTTATQPSWVLSAGGCSHRSAEVLFWPPPVASAPAGHASRTLRSATMAGSHVRAARMEMASGGLERRRGHRWMRAAWHRAPSCAKAGQRNSPAGVRTMRVLGVISTGTGRPAARGAVGQAGGRQRSADGRQSSPVPLAKLPPGQPNSVDSGENWLWRGLCSRTRAVHYLRTNRYGLTVLSHDWYYTHYLKTLFDLCNARYD
jgi:hypothetical protein